MAGNTSGSRPLGLSQTFEHDFQVVFHVLLHHLATLDHQVHERIVPGGPLTSDVPGVLLAHLYPSHHLLAKVVRMLHIATLQNPSHRRSLCDRIFQRLFRSPPPTTSGMNPYEDRHPSVTLRMLYFFWPRRAYCVNY